MNKQQAEEETIFQEALALPLEQRAAYLMQSCAGDNALRERIETLLEAALEADPFFSKEPLRIASLSEEEPRVQPTEHDAETAHSGMAKAEDRPEAANRIGRYKLLQ